MKKTPLPTKLNKLKETIQILFDEACVLEGEPVSNPGEFVRMLNEILMKNQSKN